jgi:hypothetical protein
MLNGMWFTVVRDHKPANIVADTLSKPLGHVAVPQRPGMAAHTPATVNIPSRLTAAVAAAAGLTIASIVLSKVGLQEDSSQPADVPGHAPGGQLPLPGCEEDRDGRRHPFLCDMTCGYTCPLLPAVDRQAFFQAGHIVVHPGTRATQRLLTTCFFWRGMKIVMTSWCRDYQ